MKPIRLAFSGIRSYRSPAEIDFTGLDLFAIIGDTGAGKSTILEAITFALYGRKTWKGGTLDELIADGEKKLVVEFTFAADGDVWTVQRTCNRTTTPAVHKLVNRSGSVKVDGAAAVTDMVVKLLGLKFDQFTRAVLMPQGRFDELLRASTGERTRILTSILGLDELKLVRGAAEVQLGTWKERVVEARGERNGLPADPAAVLAAAVDDHATAAAKHQTLVAAAGAATAASTKHVQVSSAAQAVRDALSRLPALDSVAELDRLAALGRDLVDEAGRQKKSADAADGALQEIAAEQGSVLQGLADRDALVTTSERLRTAAGRLGRLHVDLESVAGEIAQLEAARPAETVDPKLTKAVAKAAKTVDHARAALDTHAAAREGATVVWDTFVAARDQAAVAGAALRTAIESRESAVEAASTAERAEEAHRRELEAAEEAQAAAVRADAAAEAAAECRPGDDCPVCARPLPKTFRPPAAANLKDAKAAVAVAKQALRGAIDAHAQAKAARNQVDKDLARAEQAGIAAHGELERATAAAVAASLDLAAADRTDALAPFEAALHAAAEELRSVEETAKLATEAVAAAETALQKERVTYETKLADRERHRSALQRDRKEIATEVQQVPAAWQPVVPLTVETVDAVVSQMQVALQQLDEISTRRDELSQEAAAARYALESTRAASGGRGAAAGRGDRRHREPPARADGRRSRRSGPARYDAGRSAADRHGGEGGRTRRAGGRVPRRARCVRRCGGGRHRAGRGR